MSRLVIARTKLKLFLNKNKDFVNERNVVIKKIFNHEFMRKAKERKISSSIITTWKGVMKTIYPLGKITGNNRVKIFPDGDEAFQSMWTSIQNAKKKVWLQTYICEPDAVGMKTIELLRNARKSGADVRLFLDMFGSLNLLLKKGIYLSEHFGQNLSYFSTPVEGKTSLFDRMRMFVSRNHRKILLTDDVAYCGGMNISSDWCGKKLGGKGTFRDIHMMIQGPAANDLKSVILSDLEEADPQNETDTLSRKTELLDLEGEEEVMDDEEEEEEVEVNVEHDDEEDDEVHPSPKPAESGVIMSTADHHASPNSSISLPHPQALHPGDFVDFVQVMYSKPFQRNIELAFRTILRNATKHAFITTPYFLPPRPMKAALKDAARRGVQVIVLTAGKSDVPFITWAARHLYDVFLQAGVRIYEMDEAFLHAKTLTIDGVYCSIGSWNLDLQSHKNLEVTSSMLDPEKAEWLEIRFYEDLKLSKEVTLGDLKASHFSKVGWFFSYQLVTTFFGFFRFLEKAKRFTRFKKVNK